MHYTFPDFIRPCTLIYLATSCTPDDGLPQIQSFDGLLLSNEIEMFDSQRIIMTGMVFLSPHYRIFHARMNNVVLENINQMSFFNIVGILGSFGETIQISNFIFKNVTTNNKVVIMNYSQEVQAKNITIENFEWIQNEVINFDTNLKVDIKNISFTNFKTAPFSSFSPISINGFSTSSYFIKDIYAENITLNSLPLFTIETRPSYFSFINGNYKNALIKEESALLEFKKMSSFSIKNHTFANINSLNPLDSIFSLIKIKSIDTQDLVESNIENFSITNSTAGFLRMESIQGNPILQKLISVRNISYTDSTFRNVQTLFLTKGFFGNSNIRVIFSELLIKNIIFESEGQIILSKHQLPSAVEFILSTFENITSGKVIVETLSTNIKEYQTRILFKDCIFQNINSPRSSFFNSGSQSIVEIRNTSFSNFTLDNQRPGIFTMVDKSSVSIYDSVIQRNSASLFRIESESKFI